MLAIRTIEGVLIAVGLGLLFYSIYQHNRARRTLSAGVDELPSEWRYCRLGSSR